MTQYNSHQMWTEKTARHLGDGVYVDYDGYAFWLRANSHIEPTDEICLEPDVLYKLNRYAEEVKNEAKYV